LTSNLKTDSTQADSSGEADTRAAGRPACTPLSGFGRLCIRIKQNLEGRSAKRAPLEIETSRGGQRETNTKRKIFPDPRGETSTRADFIIRRLSFKTFTLLTGE
jgi:hypothetical protein